nr:hypothetical protein [uncultured Bacillus sp.]
MEGEKGSTLIQVLLVILIFSVIGMSLIGSVAGENKRVQKTDTEVQARNLARDGLSYFESDFKKYMANNEQIHIYTFLDSYKKGKIISLGGSGSKADKVKITADIVIPEKIEVTSEDSGKMVNTFTVQVVSQGVGKSATKALTGYYTMKFDINIDTPTLEIADFTNEGTAVDVTQMDIIGLDLWLLDLSLINIKGSDQDFYRIPNDYVVGLNLLGPLLGFTIGDGNRFKMMEERRIICTREGVILGLGLLNKLEKFNLLKLNVITLKDENDTNVVIDGGFTAANILFFAINGYRHIDFKKLAVIGNTLIQQDRYGNSVTKDKIDRRRFTFEEGLYANKTLIIGGVQGNTGNPASYWEKYSKLLLRGDMAVGENLTIEDVDLVLGDTDERDTSLSEEARTTDMYVHGNTEIKNACVKRKNDRYDLRLFTMGTLNLSNNTIKDECRNFDGLYYAKNGITVDTKDKDITINGGVMGQLTVKGSGKVTINVDPKYLQTITLSNAELIPKGRTYK